MSTSVHSSAALWNQKVSDWLSDSVTRSPFELSWTAKKGRRAKKSSTTPLWGHRLPVRALALSALRARAGWKKCILSPTPPDNLPLLLGSGFLCAFNPRGPRPRGPWLRRIRGPAPCSEGLTCKSLWRLNHFWHEQLSGLVVLAIQRHKTYLTCGRFATWVTTTVLYVLPRTTRRSCIRLRGFESPEDHVDVK